MRRIARLSLSALALASASWVLAILAAPVALESSHRAVSLGATGVYAAGANVCHQRPERSFHIAGRQMPVCARCTGLYVSAALGLPLAMLFAAPLSASRARRLLILAALPTAITWSLEYAGVMPFGNAARALAALPLGCAAAWLVVSQCRIE